MRIGLTDFRAFADTGLIEIKPLTFIVGENSSGKTSFLSALNYVWRFQERTPNLSFSQSPFDLGTFDEIVHRVRGRKRPDCFCVTVSNSIVFNPNGRFGITRKNDDTRAGVATLQLHFSNSAGETKLSKLVMVFGDSQLQVAFDQTISAKIITQGRTVFDSTDGEGRLALKDDISIGSRFDFSFIEYFLSRLAYNQPGFREGKPSDMSNKILEMQAALEALTQSFPRAIFASAPVRSSPSRVYTPVDQGRSPEGRHTPQILFKIKETDKGRWERLKNGLDEFGRLSGMFTKIDVSRYRTSGSSPFQISVSLNGKQSNLMDVGYGISQTLPILTDLIESPPRSGFLFQQPEVHLHPQAQAALGSYFAHYTASHRSSYIVAETHSDYMIDRVRYEARVGTIKNTDVAILYFEGRGTDVSIHQISLDKSGNVIGAPPEYRGFFLLEQMRVMGLD